MSKEFALFLEPIFLFTSRVRLTSLESFHSTTAFIDDMENLAKDVLIGVFLLAGTDAG